MNNIHHISLIVLVAVFILENVPCIAGQPSTTTGPPGLTWNLESSPDGNDVIVLAAGRAGVWAITDSDPRQIFYKTGTYDNCDSGIGWEEVETTVEFSHISSGFNSVWAVERWTGNLYFRKGISQVYPTGEEWIQAGNYIVDTGLAEVFLAKKVSASGQCLVVVKTTENKYLVKENVVGENVCEGSAIGQTEWGLLPGRFRQVAAGFSGLWGLSRYRMFYMEGTYGGGAGMGGYSQVLARQSAQLLNMCSGHTGVWGVDIDGDILYYPVSDAPTVWDFPLVDFYVDAPEPALTIDCDGYWGDVWILVAGVGVPNEIYYRGGICASTETPTMFSTTLETTTTT